MPISIPVLPSRDFDATAAWWAALGFTEHARWPGSYLILVGPHDVEVHFFSSEVDPLTNDHGGYVRFPSTIPVRRLFERWEGIDGVHPPQETTYGLVEGAVVDPDGNLLKFGGIVESVPTLSAIFVDTPGDLDEASGFWASAFSSTVGTDDGTYRVLADRPGGLDVEIQRIGDGSPRYHIDFAVADVDEALAHFEALGASRVARIGSWWVLRAPSEHLFCIVPR